MKQHKHTLIPIGLGILALFAIIAFNTNETEENPQTNKAEVSKEKYVEGAKNRILTSYEAKDYVECLKWGDNLESKYPDSKKEIQETLDKCLQAQELELKKTKIDLRQKYGESLRESFLDKGFDIKVYVDGENKDRIKLTYPLFNDVWSHKMNKQGTINTLCQMGFKKITMADNYKWGYEWNCNK